MQSCSGSGYKNAFTLIELLVVIAIVAVLAAILFPVFSQARGMGRRVVCLSNLRQLGTAFLMYSEDYEGSLPGATDGGLGAGRVGGWIYYSRFPANRTPGSVDATRSVLYPYIGDRRIFVCPDDSEGQQSGNSYAINSCLSERTETGYRPGRRGNTLSTAVAETALLTEEASHQEGDFLVDEVHQRSTDDGLQNIEVGNFLSERHADGSVVLFLDGHTKAIKGNAPLTRLQTGTIQSLCP